jgi:DNA-binding transcriptional LysR family regulator
VKHFDEIRTIAKVATLGTVSAAARELGVHRATVQRHVDILEGVLGTPLFIRHSRGYTPTETALQLKRLAEQADEGFQKVARSAQSTRDTVAGTVTINCTTLIGFLLVEAIDTICQAYPEIRIRLACSDHVARLETGDAQISVRFGAQPNNPDYVVQQICTLETAYYASPTYVARHGIPSSAAEYGKHFFAGPLNDTPAPPVLTWMRETVPSDRILLACAAPEIITKAVYDGLAIGLLPVQTVPPHAGMVQVVPPRREWDLSVWLVTHVDLHRTATIQACSKIIKKVLKREDGPTWTPNAPHNL